MEYEITKPIRMIELFSGYGSQSLALKYLKANYESYKTSEWDINAICAYKQIHMPNDDTDYSADFDKDYIVNYLYKFGISVDGKEPLSKEKIARKSEKQLREIYNNIVATHNVGSVTNIDADDLRITDREKYEYIFTYSFPCQSISEAGKRIGFDKGSGTASSLLWEVERILYDCKDKSCLPDILLMENVAAIHNKKNVSNFNLWLDTLSDLGYTSFYSDLNAKNCGIPQNRERTFVISLLGDYSYEFPKKIPLNKRLDNLLEDNVDERYYLDNEKTRSLIARLIENGTLPLKHNSIDTIEKLGNIYGATGGSFAGNVYNQYGLAPTIGTYQGGNRQPLIIEETHYIPAAMRGRNPENPSDRTAGIHTEQRLEIHDDGISNCVTSVSKDTLIVEQKDKITEIHYRIRKLTPNECFRLMGVHNSEFSRTKLKLSNSALYKLAGNSIVVNCLMGLFSQLNIKGIPSWNSLVDRKDNNYEKKS